MASAPPGKGPADSVASTGWWEGDLLQSDQHVTCASTWLSLIGRLLKDLPCLLLLRWEEVYFSRGDTQEALWPIVSTLN